MQSKIDAKIAQDATLAATKELKQDKTRLQKALDKEQLKNESLTSEVRTLDVNNARLKVRAEFSILGDGLLTVGSIGFGFLGVCGRDMFPFLDTIDFRICLGVALAAAGIGLLIKSFLWFRQIFSS